MNVKRKNKILLLLSVVCFLFFYPMTETVFATGDLNNETDGAYDERFQSNSPWLDGADESIYSNSIDAKEDNQEIEPKSPGLLEKSLSELIRNGASSLIALLEDNLGAGIDSIVYGRVGSGHANSVNIFGFELRSGNPYGVTASVCYTVVRSMAFLFLGVSFVFVLVKGAWSGQTAQTREQIKSSIYYTVSKFVVLTLMPYLFDLAIYVRDVILYGIKQITGDMLTGGATLSLSNVFLLNAERSGRFIDAVMYLGTVLLTLYFAFVYVAVAIDLLICFVSFPIMVLLQSPKKNLLENWIMNVLSDLLTPVLDAILLLVPLLASMMLGDVIKGIVIIQLIMCMLIIPSRNRIKTLLGVHSNERMGILGAMALMTMGRGLIGRVKSAFSGAKDIKSDWEKGKMHEELDEVDEKERESLLTGYSDRDKKNQELDSDFLQNEQADLEKADDLSWNRMQDEVDYGGESLDQERDFSDDEKIQEDFETIGELQEDNNGITAKVEDIEKGVDEIEDSLDVSEDSNLTNGEMSERDTGIPLQRNQEEMLGESKDVELKPSSDPPITRNEAIRQMEGAIDQKQQYIDKLKEQKAGYQTLEKQKAREMLDYDRGSEEYQDLEKQRANAALKAAQTEEKISGQVKALGQLKQDVKSVRGNMQGITPTTFDEERADILCKRANINNFELPEMRSQLSNAQLSELYKKRAKNKAIKGVAGAVGAGVGATFVAGSSIFMGPSTTMMGAAGGAMVGSKLGEAGATAGMAGISNAKKFGKTVHQIIETEVQTKLADAASSVTLENITNHDEGVAQKAVPVPVHQKVAAAVNRNPIVTEQEVILSEEVLKQQLNIQVEQDTNRAMHRILTEKGNARSSDAIRALTKANVEVEKYVASVRETQGIELGTAQIREKRIELQTELLTEAVMNKLSLSTEYEKGSALYQEAQKRVTKRVKEIIEKQNKNIF